MTIAWKIIRCKIRLRKTMLETVNNFVDWKKLGILFKFWQYVNCSYKSGKIVFLYLFKAWPQFWSNFSFFYCYCYFSNAFLMINQNLSKVSFARYKQDTKLTILYYVNKDSATLDQYTDKFSSLSWFFYLLIRFEYKS